MSEAPRLDRSSVRWCRRCNRPDRDPGLAAMNRTEPGTVAWYDALRSWAPEPCLCEHPDFVSASDEKQAGN